LASIIVYLIVGVLGLILMSVLELSPRQSLLVASLAVLILFRLLRIFINKYLEKVSKNSGPSAEKNIPPASRSTAASSWNCPCGKTNPGYTSTCSCGKNKRDVLLENKN